MQLGTYRSYSALGATFLGMNSNEPWGEEAGWGSEEEETDHVM